MSICQVTPSPLGRGMYIPIQWSDCKHGAKQFWHSLRLPDFFCISWRSVALWDERKGMRPISWTNSVETSTKTQRFNRSTIKTGHGVYSASESLHLHLIMFERFKWSFWSCMRCTELFFFGIQIYLGWSSPRRSEQDPNTSLVFQQCDMSTWRTHRLIKQAPAALWRSALRELSAHYFVLLLLWQI